MAFVPVELIKVRAQQNNLSNLVYRDEVSKILRKDGIKGLYRGFMPMFMREVPTFGIYFLSYHLYQRLLGLDPKSQINFENKSALIKKMIAGGFAG